MHQTAKDDLEAVVAKETWTIQDYQEMLEHVLTLSNPAASLGAILSQMTADGLEVKGSAALKVGMIRYVLCRFGEALEALAVATDNKDRHYFQGLCYKQLRQYDRAIAEFQRALDKGADQEPLAVELTEVQALSGDLEQAEKSLSKIEKKVGQTADYFYLKGLVDELLGNAEQAADAYEKACEADPDHSAATFRLAYHYDLHGDEELAMELYRRAVQQTPLRANALLNLAVLYEDAGRYDEAASCLRSILATNPNHQRARLFLRDVRASKTMYYDEDQAKRIARRNAVLDIPVTDFELSVRARNCLKKMNLRTLGDLVNITESELLSYKNFGETSLKEIKDMLTAKNLRLGQALEDDSELSGQTWAQSSEPTGQEGMLATPIERVEFSVRARRALESLKIVTLGDLVGKSETELMSCRNFGQTSLNEIRQRLAEFGLKLRESI